VFSVVLSLCLGITPAVIVKLKTLQIQTVFVISTLFQMRGAKTISLLWHGCQLQKRLGTYAQAQGWPTWAENGHLPPPENWA